MIEIRNLVKRYGDHVAVDHLNLALEGKGLRLPWPQWGGKSTTMNIMIRLSQRHRGRRGGQRPQHSGRARGGQAFIGYLPELPPLYQDMTVTEYLAFCAELKRVPPEERTAQLRRWSI